MATNYAHTSNEPYDTIVKKLSELQFRAAKGDLTGQFEAANELMGIIREQVIAELEYLKHWNSSFIKGVLRHDHYVHHSIIDERIKAYKLRLKTSPGNTKTNDAKRGSKE